MVNSLMSDSRTSFRLEDFEYELPAELIAQEPPAVRHASRLMHVNRARHQISHFDQFSQLPDIHNAGDLIVVNDTRVIPARLVAHRKTGARIEILLLKPEAGRAHLWLALASPLKKLSPEEQKAAGEAALAAAGV